MVEDYSRIVVNRKCRRGACDGDSDGRCKWASEEEGVACIRLVTEREYLLGQDFQLRGFISN